MDEREVVGRRLGKDSRLKEEKGGGRREEKTRNGREVSLALVESWVEGER